MNPDNPFELTGKVALVTGASRGIGENIARMIAKQGAHVIISSRKIDDCQKVADSIVEDGGSASAIACHIGDLQQIESLFNQISDRHDKLDILVNNAATNPYFGHILDTDLAAYEKTVDVNIRGYFFMSTTAGKLMRDNGGGAIVNIASINGVVPGAFQGIYSITKAAVISMTKSFAKECASANIRVNAVLPGATDTKFAAALVKNDAVLNQLMPHVPMQRVAEPQEIAGSVLYLVSDAASYTTGSCITVDGGFLIG
ncbi:MAG: short-chain dehydrogenase [Gammaproteobacteria bacterium]|nr:MAG: short-chain dehydrogenase [Gammaproteobacteria bacterium]